MLWHQHITTTQTYLSATNEDLRKTQVLLQQARLEEECYMKNNWYSNPQWWYIGREELSPMPENIIVKDPNLFESIRNNQFLPNVQRGYWRGVHNFV